MNTKDKLWSNIFVGGITVIIFAMYITAVFFTVQGNWGFLQTSDYWAELATGVSFAFVLRFIWSVKGTEVALIANDKIRNKEQSKSELISQVDVKGLTEDLQVLVDTTNSNNKKKAYRNKCDRKIKLYRRKLIPFRKPLLNKWLTEKENTFNEDFNWDNVKVKYYKYEMDNLLSSYFKGDDTTDGDTSNTSLLGITVLSMRTNVLTTLAMIFFTALQVLGKDFEPSDIYALLGKIVIFLMNMRNGYGLGKKYIDVLYNRQLTKDYTFLKTFLDGKGVR